MSAQDKEQLIADHFLFKEADKYLKSCGMNKDWPNGRGIFISNDKTFMVWVNEEDHLRFISMEKGAEFVQVFERLCRAVNLIEEQLKFAKTP